jgi:hypothetical protein
VEQCIVRGGSLKRAAGELGLESRKNAENRLRMAVGDVLDSSEDPRQSAAEARYTALRDMAGRLPGSAVYRPDDRGRLTAVSGVCAATRRGS